MRHPRRIALVALALAAGACSDGSPVAPGARQAPGLARIGEPVPGSYVVVMRKGASSGALAARVAAAGATVERDIAALNVLTVSGLSAADAAALASEPGVAAVAQDVMVQWLPPSERTLASGARVQAQPLVVAPQGTDQSGAFFYPVQWNLMVTKADQAWTASRGGAGATVCVLDSGVDPGHQDLLGKVDLSISASFVPAEPFVEDLNAHGSFVSSQVATNGLGIASTAPDATLCAVKVLDASGSGQLGWMIAGIVHAADAGADVINLSLSAYFDRTLPGADVLIRAVTDAVAYARAKGSQVVAATGNDGIDLAEDGTMIVVPAEIPGVLAVTATAPVNQQGFDMLASYANYGGRLGAVDLAAPGGDLVTGGQQFDLVLGVCSRYVCGADGFYLLGAGTSFASPMVAGAGAVAESANGRDVGAKYLDDCIMNGVDRIFRGVRLDTRYGRGRLNVLRSAQLCT